MRIVDVTPLSRNVVLSYFTTKSVSLGDIVVIPLFKKDTVGIVLSVRDASDGKAAIKESPFGLQKIKSVKSSDFFSPSFIAACKKTAEYFATETGIIIKSIIPTTILKTLAQNSFPYVKPKKPPEENQTSRRFEEYIVQLSEKERFAAYKGIIREEFAKGHSVLFLAPTIHHATHAASLLERGIEDYTYLLYDSLSKSKLLSVWSEIAVKEHPVLIVGTKGALGVPREDIGTIIVDEEESWSHKSERAPFVDVRVAAENRAEALPARYIVGATTPSLEKIHARERGEIADFTPAQSRLLSSAEHILVDMRPTHSPLQLTPKAFTVISDPLKEAVESAHKENQHVFLFTVRRGLYPLTLCSDCGTIIVCAKCETPLVLHKKNKKEEIKNRDLERRERTYLCHTCGLKNEVEDRCKNCTSWRLAPLGVGIERVEEEIKRLFPLMKTVRIDADVTPSQMKADKKMTEFLNSPGSILIGTEMALNMLKKRIAVTAAVSIDPLFALPSFRMNERAFGLLIALREKANKTYIIQTRMPRSSLFEYVQNGNLTDFYREEKKARELFAYPPYTTIIKLTMRGGRQSVEENVAFVKQHLREYEPFVFPAFTSKARGEYVVHAAIKIEPNEWPDKKLSSLLKDLPNTIAVNVDPEHLL